ncbi:hypothetical protein BU15DRAFT_87709 [Melanogaster broomeanus]|nr:hypothetical protein BU15DRAFT_87709 [Melanogaster broomeanus]
MLRQNPDENNGANDVLLKEDTAPITAAPEVLDAATIQSVMDVLKATPELQMTNDLNEYLTSPLIDSPFDDDLLTTPAIGSADMHADILTSPLMGDFGDSFAASSRRCLTTSTTLSFLPSKPQNEHLAPPHQPNFDAMYQLESPNTPFLDSSSSSPCGAKSTATGTRKNVTPESLVPVDAPTQPRKYLTPSATSRKELPAVFARKHELGEEQQQIEAKRRQNTIAARRSRKRKLEYQKELEDSVERYKSESEIWKQRAMTCQALLRSHRIECPDFPDP